MNIAMIINPLPIINTDVFSFKSVFFIIYTISIASPYEKNLYLLAIASLYVFIRFSQPQSADANRRGVDPGR